MASVPFDGNPCFFSLELTNRNNSAEEYKFRLLLVRQGQFWLDDIQHCFRIEPVNHKSHSNAKTTNYESLSRVAKSVYWMKKMVILTASIMHW